MSRKAETAIRAFGMSGLQIVTELDEVSERQSLELGHVPKMVSTRQMENYDQFPSDLRRKAAAMAEYYEVFFCLENSIRSLVKEMLHDAEGPNWWDSKRVDENKIRNQAQGACEKEIGIGVTPRSEECIDYSTFGQLSQLITDNWDVFETVFSSKSAVSRVTNDLNLLRGPIAHLTLTEELERDRLVLADKSWFQLLS